MSFISIFQALRLPPIFIHWVETIIYDKEIVKFLFGFHTFLSRNKKRNFEVTLRALVGQVH